MNKYRWLVALIVLVLASLACQTVMGGGSDTPSSTMQSPVPPVNTDNGPQGPAPTDAPPQNGGEQTNNSQFPLPTDASITIQTTDTVVLSTKMSINDTMAFYRDALGKKGLTERKLLTVTSGNTFSMVFDGDPSGKAIAVQGVDMGDGTTTVTITLQNI